MRSKPGMIRWRERVAALLQNLLPAPRRRALAHALEMSPGRVETWACEALADGSTLPVYAVVHMPKAERDALLAAIAEWGDLNDRGEL